MVSYKDRCRDCRGWHGSLWRELNEDAEICDCARFKERRFRLYDYDLQNYLEQGRDNVDEFEEIIINLVEEDD